MDSPLSITSSVISILTFIVATLIWLGQHLDRAIKLDDEIATTALMLIRSCGETSEIQFISLKESTKLNYQLARMWTLDLESIDVLIRILRLSTANRFLQWGEAQNFIRGNSKELKKLRSSMNTITLLVLPKQIGEVQQTLTGLGNATNEILEGKFNSLKTTHQEEPPKEALDFASVLRRQRKKRAEERRLHKEPSEELFKEALKEPLEEQHDGPSDRPMEEMPRAHSGVQAAEQAEEPSENQSELKSEEHSGSQLEEQPEESNNSMHAFEGINLSGNVHHMRFVDRRPSLPAINRDEITRALDEQAFRDQLQAHLQSRMTQTLTEMGVLSRELAHFIHTKKIRPSQLSNLVLLFALFLLGSQGLATKSDAAREKMEGKGRRDQGMEDDLEMSGGI